MRIATTRFAALFVFTAVVVETNAVAQLTKLNVGYVGITSDNAAAFIARDTGIFGLFSQERSADNCNVDPGSERVR